MSRGLNRRRLLGASLVATLGMISIVTSPAGIEQCRQAPRWQALPWAASFHRVGPLSTRPTRPSWHA